MVRHRKRDHRRLPALSVRSDNATRPIFAAGGHRDEPMPSAGERRRVSPPQHAKSNRGRAPRPGRSSGIGKQLALGFALALGSTAITWAQAYPSRARRHVRAALRSAGGFRSGCPGVERSTVDRRAQDHAGQRPEGVRRLAEGEPGSGDPGDDRGRRHIDRGRLVFSKSNRHTVQVRPLSRRPRPRHARSRRRPDRFHDRHGGQFAAASACRQDQGPMR
jgi:hypothetical protein